MPCCAGRDRGGSVHAVCIIDAAGILAALGNVDERFPAAGRLGADAAPVTRASGEASDVTFPRACNESNRQTIAAFGEHSRHASRSLARAWYRLLWKPWQDRSTYDPAHGNVAARIAA